jgi:ubiquinone/menaquinone biosynthesis C-methylase UbiE
VDLVADGYDAVYAAWPASPTLQGIWQREARGSHYPTGFEHISFLTVDELQQIAAQLELSPGGRVLDVACGAGGPGLWVAQQNRATLLGVDFSRIGIRLAARRATNRPVVAADFMVAAASAVGLVDGSVDGALSIDALQYVPDKRSAFAEVARLLSPGRRFAFTAFELDPHRVAGLPVLGVDPVADYAPVLHATGFDVVTYEETSDWQHRLDATFRAVVAAQDALAAEMSEQAIAALLMEASLTLEFRPYRRRVLVLASRH